MEDTDPLEHVYALKHFAIQRAICTVGVFAVERTLIERASPECPDGEPIVPTWATVAVPFVRIFAESTRAAKAFAYGWGAVQISEETAIDLPIHCSISSVAHFAITGNTITFTTRGIVSLVLDLDPRMTYFLKLTQMLGVEITDGSSRFFGTVELEGSGNPWPKVSSLPGRMNRQAIAKSTKWEGIFPSTAQNLVGGEDIPDDHNRIYGATTRTRFIPPQTVRDRCLRCGVQSLRLTVEHCTPKWLTDRLQVAPVTARILCEPCNKSFGSQLETPVAGMFANNTALAPANQALVSQWAVKTAVLLSAVSNVRIPKQLLKYVEDGQPDPYITMHVSCGNSTSCGDGYKYQIMHFRKQLGDCFLFEMEFGQVAFIVARAGSPISRLPQLDRWIPTFLPGRNGPCRRQTVVDEILHDYFDVCLDYTPATMQVAPRRQ